MSPNDPTSGHDGEETSDWPRSEPASAAPGSAEPRFPPAASEVDPDGATMEAPKFTRPPQQPPVPPTSPSWPNPQQPQAPQWVQGAPSSYGQAPPAGYPPHNQSPPGAYLPHSGYQQPPVGGPPQGRPGQASGKPTLSSQMAQRRWWIVGGASALAAVVVIALVATNGGEDSDTVSEQPSTTAAQVPAAPITTVPSDPAAPEVPGAPAPAPSGPTLGVDALAGLLLSAEQVGQRLDTPGMSAMDVESNLLDGTITPPECASAWGPAYAATYNGSGFTGLAVQGVFLEPSAKVAQAVVAFPDPGAAKSFFDKQSAAWSGCKSTHVTFSYAGNSTGVDVGVPAMTGDIMTLKLVPTTSSVAGQQCERDMTVRGNVIVDVRSCLPTVGSGGLSIVSDIAAKIR